jgi:hypothetical protein
MSTADSNWRTFVRKHRGAVALFATAVVLAFVGAVYVFWWFAGTAVSSGLVPSTLGLWTIGNLVAFALYGILWELVLIGVPVAVGAGIGWWWWTRLPYEERAGYRFRGSGRSTGGGGGVGFLIFLGFCLKVYLDGKWNVPLANFSVIYVADSLIVILAWGAIIAGIFGAIALVWWLRRAPL